MARKSQRISSSAAVKSAHKRAASLTAVPTLDSKKTKTGKATPTKSQYFENAADKSKAEQSDASGDEILSSAPDGDVSDFESASDTDNDMGEDDYESDEVSKSSRKKPTHGKGKELWREGVKVGLGKQVVIKKPKARPAGRTAYSDETVHPNTLLFLTELKANNDRGWLKMHDPDFRQAEKDWFSFVEKLTEKLVGIDETIPELPVKDIASDLSSIPKLAKTTDRDPDLSHLPRCPFLKGSDSIQSRTGRKGPYAHYYIQISPNNETFVGGGLWHPEASPTAAMRRAIDQHPRHLKDILLEDGMRTEFLKGAPDDIRKVVKAFVTANAETALKTRPKASKGYDADHPDIDLLRLKNYTIGRKVTDDELLGLDGLDRIAELLGRMKGFITYLNSVVMPDEAESESGDDENDSQGSSSGSVSGNE